MGEWAQHGHEGSIRKEGDAPSAAKAMLAVLLATAPRTSWGRQRSRSGFSAGRRIPGAALKRELQLSGGTLCRGGGQGSLRKAQGPRAPKDARAESTEGLDAWLHTIFIIGLQNSERPLGVVFLQEQGWCAQLLPQPLRTWKSLPG